MRNYLLSLVALLGAQAAFAQAPEQTAVKSAAESIRVTQAKPVSTMRKAASKKMKKFDNRYGLQKIKPATRKSIRRAEGELPQGVSFLESFEGCDPTVYESIPEGWSVISTVTPLSAPKQNGAPVRLTKWASYLLLTAIST